MITKHAITLNGVALHALDESIITQSVRESAAQVKYNTLPAASGRGQWAGRETRQSLDVTVQFAIREKRDMRLRSDVLDKVMRWAHGGGWLETRYRPGRRLHVRLVQFPNPGDVRVWNDSMTMIFRAYEIPYWQEVIADEAQHSNVNFYNLIVSMRGTADTPMEAEVTARAAVDDVSFGVGGQVMQLRGLGMRSGDVLVIRHDVYDRLQLVVRSGDTERNVYAKRTVDSVDDVMLSPGRNNVQVASNANCDWNVSARGRWL